MATRPIQTTTKTRTARRKLPALASDAAGCQEFGQGVATATQLFHPFGELTREEAPANDNVERAKTLLCPAP